MENVVIEIKRGDRVAIVKDLKRQYPWFNEKEIVEAVERFDCRYERILAYLDMKSGRWEAFDLE